MKFNCWYNFHGMSHREYDELFLTVINSRYTNNIKIIVDTIDELCYYICNVKLIDNEITFITLNDKIVKVHHINRVMFICT